MDAGSVSAPAIIKERPAKKEAAAVTKSVKAVVAPKPKQPKKGAKAKKSLSEKEAGYSFDGDAASDKAVRTINV